MKLYLINWFLLSYYLYLNHLNWDSYVFDYELYNDNMIRNKWHQRYWNENVDFWQSMAKE